VFLFRKSGLCLIDECGSPVQSAFANFVVESCQWMSGFHCDDFFNAVLFGEGKGEEGH